MRRDETKPPSVDKRKVARRATETLDELLRPPKREGALRIRKYANTDFVSLMLEGGFYEEFERASLELGVPAELSALRALEDHHEKMRRAIALKNKASGESATELEECIPRKDSHASSGICDPRGKG